MYGIGSETGREETRAFLGEHGHGILSLAREGTSYGIPLSYGYDEGQHRCIFQLLSVEDSRKEQFLEATEQATLTVYDYGSEDGSWQSAIATGAIVELPDEAVSNRAAAIFFRRAADTAATVRESSDAGPDRRWYALEVDSLSGREAEGSPER
ncbi:MAG: nitroimidazol reductase NimA-like FMN-containing flavoprotein [Halobacteriales archaeon]|jgi:nitroimidazol reductase NimA-like FMN-containing flavoprotein (pyridoxamine 5'-phosphate oxidase superfamily)